MITDRSYTDDERRHFLRYTRTQSWPMLQRFPVDDDLHAELLAQMLASTPETIRALLHSLRDETRAAATQMLADDHFRNAVAALPFGPEDRIAAVGDSITADRLGWFELLAASIDLTGVPKATLINLGISGNTTADVLERFDLLEAVRPTRVLLMLGTNDARAHGRTGRYRMATTAETGRNLRALVNLITQDLNAVVTIITPPAVNQQRIDTFFNDAPLHWQAAAVAEVAGVAHQTAPGALDLHKAIHARGTEDLLEPDGVHPTLAGQRLILASIVDHLRTVA
ncbi:SGNH/GDSL hydrolase family protein [Asanoa ishikariensis]|uniref:SGNH/GDSL hydrolase family protein n=1 Tax=Asanoa ishikariensis TaxID=137265 RepID=UPI00115FFA0D|nr:GDSL-type esterase/lipase family protein [Asanoa ishikariensis]